MKKQLFSGWPPPAGLCLLSVLFLVGASGAAGAGELAGALAFAVIAAVLALGAAAVLFDALFSEP